MTIFACAGTPAAPFNRYVLTYSCPVPMRGLITYNLGGASVSEDFFLDAGEDMTFSSYINTYLDGGLADVGEAYVTLSDITIPLPEGADVKASVAFEKAEVYARETYYFENERYRVGVELAWGGGLSYILDKKCPVKGLGNLLNHFDTGRLVQQSYYGTGDKPFVRGEFMGNSWVYNPVQGGDRGAFKSKLIEARVSENEVYIKCRPRDWGHAGGVTYSYMENWYRLNGDYLEVDNRFTDYSGWKHPKNSQELPAFYTVSYLGNYYWYEGDKPWTGDTLSCRSDLPFWPDDWAYCTFHYKPENTERWAAFVDDGLYGLGLYTPGTDRWLAGRHAYNGTMDPAGGPTNYIAPTLHIRLQCYKPLTYSYLIVAGQLDDIRAKFTARKDDITNRAMMEY